jgi:hypothetical protein
MISKHSVIHKKLFRQHSVLWLQPPEISYTGKKASALVRLYWRMLPNSRITAHDCILIGEIRLQNGGSAVTREKGSCSAFPWPWADLQVVPVPRLEQYVALIARQL